MKMKIKDVDLAALEYVLNKFLPYLIIFVILFTALELTDLRPWIVCALIFFIDKYAFKIGRSVGEYENNPAFKQKVDKEVEED